MHFLLKISVASRRGRCGLLDRLGGVVFEEAGDADVEVWEGEDLLLPVFEGVDVGEDDDLSAFEGAEAF